MTTDYEAVMAALLSRISSAVPSFITVGRRVKHWTQVPDQPALFLRRVGMLDNHNGSMPTMTMECELWIYCNAGENPDVIPDAVLTGLEREVRAALAPDDQNRFTIGGLVYWCRIEGKSDISPGDQGPQAIARIPIRITLP
jgi:hypothetical protein